MEQNNNFDELLSMQLGEGEKMPFPFFAETEQKENCTSDGCTKTAQQYADISTSVSLNSTATLGKIETECLGEPSICCEETNCDNTCKITIIQKVSIKIPISYKIDACIDEDGISCDCNQDCCE